MLPGNPVRGLSTGERLRVDHLEVSSLHRDGTHRRCNHSRSQPLEVNNKQIHSNLKKNQSRERKNLWYFYDLNVMQESGGSQNAQKKTILYEGRCALLCCMCLFLLRSQSSSPFSFLVIRKYFVMLSLLYECNDCHLQLKGDHQWPLM